MNEIINDNFLNVDIDDGSVDFLLTDPPYNISKDTNFHTYEKNTVHSMNFDDDSEEKWDNKDSEEYVREFDSCEKPVELLEYFIAVLSRENDLVLDTFSGSGNVGIASMNLKRKYMLIEQEKKYFDLATNKLEGSCQLNKFL